MEQGISERKAYELVGLRRSTHRYSPTSNNDDSRLRKRIKKLAESYRRYGYRRIQVLLEREGLAVNHKRITYCEEDLTIRKKRQKKLVVQRVPMDEAERPYQIWAMDFIHDTTELGRSLKTLMAVDEYTGYLIVVEVVSAVDGAKVIKILEAATDMHGKPRIQ
jgi:putative transposase